MLQSKIYKNTPLILRLQFPVPADTRGWPGITHHMLNKDSVLASVIELYSVKALPH